MLGTPPAFVLSQDQTLKKLYLKSFDLKPFFESFALANFTQEFRWLLIRFLTSIWTIHYNCPRCLVCLTLFNLQGTGAHTVSLLILTHPNAFVKKFFLLFSKFFFCISAPEASAPKALRILADLPPFVNPLFSSFFKVFFSATFAFFSAVFAGQLHGAMRCGAYHSSVCQAGWKARQTRGTERQGSSNLQDEGAE